MKTALNVLIVEDSPEDAELVVRNLERAGHELVHERVDTAEAMQEALIRSNWDLIISDHRMPRFSSLAALKVYHQNNLNIPFIVVSGSIGEETAVAAMKAGAHDYIMKDNLARLAPAVQREVQEAEMRCQKAKGDENLRESNAHLEKALGELRETQQQVVQQERLRALGQMASGVAHDFNNGLTKILGFSDLLLTSPEKINNPVKVREHVQMISAAAQDAVGVVNRLREFYRPRRATETFQATNLNELVQQAALLTEPRWKGQAQANGVAINMRTDLQDIPLITGDQSDLRETLTNLIFNAVDAMPQGGTITLCTRPVDQQVMLEVRDTGTGMTEEVRLRCLEPFFSTKGARGTGLGLAIVYGIVQRHGGSIDVQSAVGQGTTIRIRLPIGPASPAQTAQPKTEAPSKPLRVLVAEDEPIIRDIETEYLICDGHTVTTAANGREALEIFRTGRFDLVLTDRAMPEMNGDQLAEAIKQLSPDTSVILITGFADLVEGAYNKSAADMVLPKPFTQEVLRQAVAKVTASGNGKKGSTE